jgi:hypothetical protein
MPYVWSSRPIRSGSRGAAVGTGSMRKTPQRTESYKTRICEDADAENNSIGDVMGSAHLEPPVQQLSDLIDGPLILRAGNHGP